MESYENGKSYTCKEKFEDKHAKDKEYLKIRDHCHYTGKYRGATHSIHVWKYSLSKEIPIVFHNGYIYDYDFIIKDLAEEFEGEFTCLGEKT